MQAVRRPTVFTTGSGVTKQNYPRCRAICRATQSNASRNSIVEFPKDYTEAIKQAQAAVEHSLLDGCKLVEVEFPPTSLSSVPGRWHGHRHSGWCGLCRIASPNWGQHYDQNVLVPRCWFAGDGEGANEMTYSLQYLRKFCRTLQDQAGNIRIFFPDEKVCVVYRCLDLEAWCYNFNSLSLFWDCMWHDCAKVAECILSCRNRYIIQTLAKWCFRKCIWPRAVCRKVRRLEGSLQKSDSSKQSSSLTS